MFSSIIQHLDEEMIDDESTRLKKFRLELKNRGTILQEVMPLAMRNLAIAQQSDKERYRHTKEDNMTDQKRHLLQEKW